MKCLMQMVMKWVSAKSPSEEERYLAQCVDAYDFEVRVQALERRRGSDRAALAAMNATWLETSGQKRG